MATVYSLQVKRNETFFQFSLAGLLETLQAIKRDKNLFKIVKQALCFKIICKCGSGFKLKVDSSPEFKMFGVWFFCVIFFFFLQ